MKTAQEIAQTLLNRRNAMNPVVMQGEMLAALESEGLQEALQRRWLVPQVDTGYLQVSQDMAKVQEMKEVAGQTTVKAPEAKPNEWTKAWERPNESHDFAMSHSTRRISELLSPATGHNSGGALSHGSTPTPTTSSTTTLRRPPPAATPTGPAATSVRPPAATAQPGLDKPGIGDEVLIGAPGAAESQTYTGKVSSTANGRVKINFGGAEREYPESDVKVLKKAVPTQ